jgi:hypothetical protein
MLNKQQQSSTTPPLLPTQALAQTIRELGTVSTYGTSLRVTHLGDVFYLTVLPTSEIEVQYVGVRTYRCDEMDAVNWLRIIREGRSMPTPYAKDWASVPTLEAVL